MSCQSAQCNATPCQKGLSAFVWECVLLQNDNVRVCITIEWHCESVYYYRMTIWECVLLQNDDGPQWRSVDALQCNSVLLQCELCTVHYPYVPTQPSSMLTHCNAILSCYVVQCISLCTIPTLLSLIFTFVPLAKVRYAWHDRTARTRVALYKFYERGILGRDNTNLAGTCLNGGMTHSWRLNGGLCIQRSPPE